MTIQTEPKVATPMRDLTKGNRHNPNLKIGPDMSRTYTAEELERFPSDWHYEMIKGKLRPNHLPAGRTHGKCTALLAARLTVFIDDNDLGEVGTAETGFKLETGPDTVKAPDFAFTANDRVPPPQTHGYGVFVPDLVVETRSPGDGKKEIQDKIDEWLHFGCRVVLDVDPTRETVTIHRSNQETLTLGKEDTLDGGDVLPNFSLPLSRIFR